MPVLLHLKIVLELAINPGRNIQREIEAGISTSDLQNNLIYFKYLIQNL